MQVTTLINGQAEESLPADDRGLHYGDGVFTTARLRAGRPLLIERHVQRLARDAARLGFRLNEPERLHAEALCLSEDVQYGVLKILLTRGSGQRGYRAPAEINPRRILQVSSRGDIAAHSDAAEQGIAMHVCQMRLGRQPALAGIKHLNRLEQVLARSEWRDPAVAEGLVLDDNEHVIEATQANVFFMRDAVLCTPALDHCGVEGIMRTLVLEQADAWSMPIRIEPFKMEALLSADELFITNCLIGVVPVRRLLDKTWAPGERTRRLQSALKEYY